MLTVDRVTDEYFTEYCPARMEQVGGSNGVQKSPSLLVLKFPGTAGRAERASNWPVEFLPEANTNLCTWNAPGYGGSSGPATLTNMARRAARFLSLVTREYQSQQPRVWLIGNSLGCATATYLASQTEIAIDGMILRNPPPLVETVKRVARQYPFGRLTDKIAESLPPEMNLSLTAPRANVPTVMLQSERDQLVPPPLQMEVFDALPGPKRLVVMEGLDHDGIATDDHELEIRDAIRWLWEQPLQDRSADGITLAGR